MATAYARRSFAGGAIATTIPNGMAATDTTFTLALATNWAFANNFYVDVDRGLPSEEKILCSGISGLTITVASGGRGADGSTAVQHASGCTIQVVHVAQDDDEANQVVVAVLGQSGAAKGDMLAMLSASGPNTLTRIPIGSAGQFLSATSGGLPAWASITAASITGATAGYVLTAEGATAPPIWAAASGVVAKATEISITTGSTNVVTYVPPAAGNFVVGCYFRVITSTTAVTLTASWTDVTGAQTTSILTGVSEVTGSYSLTNFTVSTTISGTITVAMTAATASQVFASASILQG